MTKLPEAKSTASQQTNLKHTDPKCANPNPTNPKRAGHEPATRYLTATTAPDVLMLTPFLLGHHPEESLVILVCVEKAVLMSLSADISKYEDPDELKLTMEVVMRENPRAHLVFVVYSEDWSEAQRAVDALQEASMDLPVIDTIALVKGHYWARSESMCSHVAHGENTPFDPDAQSGTAKEFYDAVPSAEQYGRLLDRISRPPETDLAEIEVTFKNIERFVKRRTVKKQATRLAELMTRGLADPASLKQNELAELVIIAALPRVFALAVAHLSIDNANSAVNLWQSAARVSPHYYHEIALTMLTVAAWLAGENHFFAVCLAELKTRDPSEPMIKVIDPLYWASATPSTWHEELLPKICDDIPDDLLQVLDRC